MRYFSGVSSVSAAKTFVVFSRLGLFRDKALAADTPHPRNFCENLISLNMM